MIFLEENQKININKNVLKKFEELSKLLNVEKKKLIDFAFEEFFTLVKNDPQVFLEELGFIKNLKDITE